MLSPIPVLMLGGYGYGKYVQKLAKSLQDALAFATEVCFVCVCVCIVWWFCNNNNSNNKYNNNNNNNNNNNTKTKS